MASESRVVVVVGVGVVGVVWGGPQSVAPADGERSAVPLRLDVELKLYKCPNGSAQPHG